MFLIINSEIFNTEFVGMHMTYHYAKCHMPSQNGSLVSTTKVEAKYRLNVVIRCFTSYKKGHINTSCISLNMCYHASLATSY
jgi:hypothetical protein